MRHTSLILLFSLACCEMLAQAPLKATLASGTGRHDGEGPQMICDGRTDTKWCIDRPGQMPYTIVLDAGSRQTVREYGLTTGDDTAMYPDRNPVAWRVSGSDDKETWTTLDSHTNDRSLPAENEQEYRFKPSKTGAFRYYCFEFLRMAGSSRIQLSEVSLYDRVQTPVKATALPVASEGGDNDKEGAGCVSDGFLHTKWCVDRPDEMPYAVILDAGAQTAVGEYRFYTGDDTHSYPERNPVAWRVSGSNDQKSWTLLDEQKDNRRLRDENEQEYRFKLGAKETYRYYRFEFLRMTRGTRIQLSEIRLFK